jgi:hypothetical protein
MSEFETPLVLTTPHMKGARVKDAQWLMAGHSRFDGLATLKDSNVDADYGAVSADATKRTKYWVGYPIASCDRVFGQTLYEYLRPNDWRPLPKDYRDRRAQRLAAATKTPGLKALAFAIDEIGNHENPYGSNRSKYGAWYGFDGVPWCAIFESYCFGHTGRAGYRYAACEQIYLDAKAGRNGLRLVWSPMPGDINIFNLHGNPYAHTSFFERWIDPAAGTFSDVGGNTGPSNISNGGAVMRQVRNRGMVSHFVRVG